MAGDELYDDDVTSGPIDLLAYADFRRDQLKNTSACPKCGSREPAIIGEEGCSDCFDFPRCSIHHGWLPCRGCEVVIESNDGYVVVADLA
jgi:hypothetical protein